MPTNTAVDHSFRHIAMHRQTTHNNVVWERHRATSRGMSASFGMSQGSRIRSKARCLQCPHTRCTLVDASIRQAVGKDHTDYGHPQQPNHESKQRPVWFRLGNRVQQPTPWRYIRPHTRTHTHTHTGRGRETASAVAPARSHNAVPPTHLSLQRRPRMHGTPSQEASS